MKKIGMKKIIFIKLGDAMSKIKSKIKSYRILLIIFALSYGITILPKTYYTYDAKGKVTQETVVPHVLDLCILLEKYTPNKEVQDAYADGPSAMLKAFKEVIDKEEAAIVSTPLIHDLIAFAMLSPHEKARKKLVKSYKKALKKLLSKKWYVYKKVEPAATSVEYAVLIPQAKYKDISTDIRLKNLIDLSEIGLDATVLEPVLREVHENQTVPLQDKLETIKREFSPQRVGEIDLKALGRIFLYNDLGLQVAKRVCLFGEGHFSQTIAKKICHALKMPDIPSSQAATRISQIEPRSFADLLEFLRLINCSMCTVTSFCGPWNVLASQIALTNIQNYIIKKYEEAAHIPFIMSSQGLPSNVFDRAELSIEAFFNTVQTFFDKKKKEVSLKLLNLAIVKMIDTLQFMQEKKLYIEKRHSDHIGLITKSIVKAISTKKISKADVLRAIESLEAIKRDIQNAILKGETSATISETERLEQWLQKGISFFTRKHNEIMEPKDGAPIEQTDVSEIDVLTGSVWNKIVDPKTPKLLVKLDDTVIKKIINALKYIFGKKLENLPAIKFPGMTALESASKFIDVTEVSDFEEDPEQISITHPFMINYEIISKVKPPLKPTLHIGSRNILIYPSIVNIPLAFSNEDIDYHIESKVDGQAQHYFEEIVLPPGVTVQDFLKSLIFTTQKDKKLFFIAKLSQQGLFDKKIPKFYNFAVKLGTPKSRIKKSGEIFEREIETILKDDKGRYFHRKIKARKIGDGPGRIISAARLNLKSDRWAEQEIVEWMLETIPQKDALTKATHGMETMDKFFKKVGSKIMSDNAKRKIIFILEIDKLNDMLLDLLEIMKSYPDDTLEEIHREAYGRGILGAILANYKQLKITPPIEFKAAIDCMRVAYTKLQRILSNMAKATKQDVDELRNTAIHCKARRGKLKAALEKFYQLTLNIADQIGKRALLTQPSTLLTKASQKEPIATIDEIKLAPTPAEYVARMERNKLDKILELSGPLSPERKADLIRKIYEARMSEFLDQPEPSRKRSRTKHPKIKVGRTEAQRRMNDIRKMAVRNKLDARKKRLEEVRQREARRKIERKAKLEERKRKLQLKRKLAAAKRREAKMRLAAKQQARAHKKHEKATLAELPTPDFITAGHRAPLIQETSLRRRLRM